MCLLLQPWCLLYSFVVFASLDELLIHVFYFTLYDSFNVPVACRDRATVWLWPTGKR